MAFFKSMVRGWYWDTMLGAHVLDNRTGICGLKFQSLVWCGVPDYDDHITFDAVGSYDNNNIRQNVSMHDLRKYNGIDAIVTYHTACRQMQAFRYPKPPRFI